MTASAQTTTPDTERLPWPSLLVLGAATLVMVTTEMLPTAVLAPMSDGLGVDETRTAQLVSLWAAVVVIASFPLVRLARGRDRRRVVAVGMVVLAASSALTALAPTYGAAVAARLLGAAAVGLLWATVNAHVADLVSDRLLGTAVAVVLGGATLGMVLGTPLARVVADLAGWRAAFGGLAGIGVVVAVLVRRLVAPGDTGGGSSQATRGPTASLRPMLLMTGLVAIWLIGHYGAYTFVTRLVEVPAAAIPGQVGTVLLVFGLASAAGVALAGQVAHTSRTLAAFAAITAVAIASLMFVDRGVAVGMGIVAVWGLVSGAVPPLAQTEILRRGGPEHRSTAGAIIPVLFNGGIAVGAALAALVVSAGGVEALPVPAAAVVALAAVGLAVVGVGQRSGELRK